MPRATAWMLAAALAPSALGQIEDEEVAPPAVEEPPVRIEPTIPAPVSVAPVRAVTPGQPTARDAIPGLMGQDVAVPLGLLLPEGAFLAQRLGGLVRAPTGEWIFISAADEAGRRDPPLVLLPSATLEELENRIGEDAPGVRVLMSGQVLVYHGRNYLLPTLFSVTGVQPGEAAEGEAADGEAPEGADAAIEGGEPEADSEGAEREADPEAGEAERAGDPRVAELLEQLKREGSRTEELDRPARTSSAARAAALLHDGELIVRQRGRVVRLSSGRLAFAQDQDRAEREPTVLLPSATLAEIEAAVARTGEARAVLVSGRRYVHRERMYLLPISFLFAPSNDVEPMQ